MRKIQRRKIPPGRRLIKARWVYDIKKDKDGKIEKYKARLVAKGYLQRPGSDYDVNGVFAPTPSFTSVLLICARALDLDFKVYQFDVKTAFLNSPLVEEERVYIDPPEGMECGPDECYELLKCIYGLKQAAHEWNKNVDKMLKRNGFTTVPGDDCVYTHLSPKSGDIDCIIAIHVDDILVACAPTKAKRVKSMLHVGRGLHSGTIYR